MPSLSLPSSEGSYLPVALFLFGFALFPLASVLWGNVPSCLGKDSPQTRLLKEESASGRKGALLSILASRGLSCLFRHSCGWLTLTWWPVDDLMGCQHLPLGVCRGSSPLPRLLIGPLTVKGCGGETHTRSFWEETRLEPSGANLLWMVMLHLNQEGWR